MKAIYILSLLLYIFVSAKCSNKAQEKKVMDPPLSMEEDDKEEQDDFDLSEIMSECNETFRIEMSKICEATVTQYRYNATGQFSYLDALNTSGSFPDETDKTPKCYVRCVLENSGVATAVGAFDAARTAAVLAGLRTRTPRDLVRDMAAQCADRLETCKCERSYQYMKCLIEKEIEETQDRS